MLTSLMRRHLSLVLATLFIVLGAFVLPVVYLLWMMQQPKLVHRTVDPATLYAMTIPGVVIELEKDHGIRALDGTILELNRADLTRVLRGSFSEKDVINKAEEVIHTIGTTMGQAPPDTFQFYINIKTERPVVQQYLKGYFRRKLAARPECTMGSVTGIAWMGLQKLFGKRISEDEQLRRLPHCRGPREIQDAIMKAVNARLDGGGKPGVDSIKVRPGFNAATHLLVRRTLALGRAGPWLFPIFPLLLCGIIVLSWKDRRHCYARIAAPLLITSLILLVVFIPVYFFDLDLYGAVFKMKMVALSDSTSLWLQTMFYVVKVMLRRASYDLVIFGGILLLLGLVMTRQHQRCEVPAN
ncbi:MAG: hypothetical protein ABI836_05970 [Gemmatimonadota bacterium]